MKKINIRQKDIFEIANFIKNNLPTQKIFLHKIENRLTLEFCSQVEKFKLEEIKTLLRIKYPHFQVIISQRS